MSSPNQLPAYLRYLKARLQPFRQPAFWTTGVGLVFVLLFAWEYWKHPERLIILPGNQVADSDNPTTDPTLSSDNLAAIGADIDSSSVLLKEFDRTTALPPLVSLPKQKSQTSESEELLAQFTRQQPEAGSKQEQQNPLLTFKSQQKPNVSNPFATSSQEFLNDGLLSGGSLSTKRQAPNRESSSSLRGATTVPALGFNSPNSPDANRETEPVSPLQNPPNRFTADGVQVPVKSQIPALPTPTAQGQLNYPPTTVPGVTNYTPYPTTPTAPLNSYTYPTPSQPVTSVPTAMPVTPVAPVTPSSLGQYSTQPSGQVNGVNTSGTNATPASPGIQPSQLSQPNFSVPR